MAEIASSDFIKRSSVDGRFSRKGYVVTHAGEIRKVRIDANGPLVPTSRGIRLHESYREAGWLTLAECYAMEQGELRERGLAEYDRWWQAGRTSARGVGKFPDSWLPRKVKELQAAHEARKVSGGWTPPAPPSTDDHATEIGPDGVERLVGPDLDKTPAFGRRKRSDA